MPLDAGTAQVEITPDLTRFAGKLQAGMNTALSKAGKGFAKFGAISGQLNQIGSTLTRSVSLPIIGIGGLAVKAAIDFETAFTGVRKTVEGTEAQFSKLSQGLRDMAKDTGTSAVQLSGIAEAAGALGIATDDILKFVDVVNKLDIATDLTADSAATALGKLKNVLDLSTDDLDNLANAVVDLGNKGASTEPEIVDLALRIAGAGKNAGLSTPEILGFAAAVADAGIEAERGGTAIQKTLQDIATAVATGKDLASFAKVAGQAGKDFARDFGEKPAVAVTSFIEGLKRIREQSGPGGVIVALKELGITESRQVDTLQRLAGAQSDLSDKVLGTADAYKDLGAADKEYEERQKTTEATIRRLKEGFTDIFITLGETLIPVLERSLPTIENVGKSIGEIVDAFSRLDPGTQANIVKAFAIFAVGGPIISGLGAAAGLIGSISGILRTLGGNAGTAAGQVRGLSGFLSGLPKIVKIAIVVTIVKEGIDAIKETFNETKDQNWFQRLTETVFGGDPRRIKQLSDMGKVIAETADLTKRKTELLVKSFQGVNEFGADGFDRIKAALGALKAAAVSGLDISPILDDVAKGSATAQRLLDELGNRVILPKVDLSQFDAATADAISKLNDFGLLRPVAKLLADGDDASAEVLKLIKQVGGFTNAEWEAIIKATPEGVSAVEAALNHVARDRQANVKVRYLLPGEGTKDIPFGGPKHGGGFVMHDGGSITKMHSGGIRPDERLILAQTGEFMFSRPAVQNIGPKNLEALHDAARRGDVPTGGGEHDHIVYVNLDGKQITSHVSRGMHRRSRSGSRA